MPNQIYIGFIRLPLLIRTFIIAITSIFFFGTLIHFLEPESFPTIFEGIWWAVITASTVGYGDYFPHTTIGKISGIILILTSAGFLSSFFIALATTAASRQNDHLEGKVKFKGKDHLVIIGWNERARGIIDAFSNKKNEVTITLVDETLEKNPLPKSIHFIQGRPNEDDVLIQAGIENAKKIIITADPNKGEFQADMYTILTLIAVKGLNPQVETIVEILTKEQIINANRAGADEIIQTNILTSFVMTQSIKSQDMVTSFLEMLYQLSEEKITFQPIEDEDMEKNFIDLGTRFLHEGKTLLGVKRGGATILSPPEPFLIEKNDQLIIIN